MKKKKFLFLAVMLATVFLLPACSSATDMETRQEEQKDGRSFPLEAITHDGTVVKSYDTFLDAMTAFSKREVNAFAIRLTGNHYCDAPLPDMRQDVAIDLNGYKLTLSEGVGIDIYEGTFNFFDSRGGGLLSGNREKALIYANADLHYINLYLDNISIENTGPALYVRNQMNYYPLSAKIRGGTYVSSGSSVVLMDGAGPSLEISAGEFTAPEGIAALKGDRGDQPVVTLFMLAKGSEINTAAGEYISLAPLVNNAAANKVTVKIKQ